MVWCACALPYGRATAPLGQGHTLLRPGSSPVTWFAQSHAVLADCSIQRFIRGKVQRGFTSFTLDAALPDSQPANGQAGLGIHEMVNTDFALNCIHDAAIYNTIQGRGQRNRNKQVLVKFRVQTLGSSD
jgi:hypothetical protein